MHYSRSLRAMSLAAAAALAAAGTSHAAIVYWDINGPTAGATDDAGGLAAGTWDTGTTANWNTASSGTTTVPGTWANGDVALFSANGASNAGQASGAYTVTLSGTIQVGTTSTQSIRFNHGTVTLSGGTIDLGSVQREFEVATGRTATIASALSGTAILRIGNNASYTGTLILSGSNSGFSGAVTLNRGQVLIGANNALGSGLITITTNDGKLGASATSTIANNVSISTGGTTRGLGGGTANLTINGIVYSTAEHSTINTIAGGTTILAGGVAGRIHTDGNASLAFSGDGDVTMTSRIYTNVDATTMTGRIHGSNDSARLLQWSSSGTLDLGVDANGDGILHMTTRHPVINAGTVIVRGDVFNSKLVQQTTSVASGSADFTRTAHGLVVGDVVAFRQDAVLPSGMNVGNSFYVVSTTTNTFQLSSTANGSPIVADAAATNVNIYHLTTLGASSASVLLGGRVSGGVNTANNNAAFLLASGDYSMSRALDANANGTATNPIGANTNVLTIGGIGAQDYLYSGTITLGSILGTSANVNRTNVGRDLTVRADADGTVEISGLIRRVTGTTDAFNEDTGFGGSFGTAGLIKVGLGTANLTRPAGNTYDGTTRVHAGTLLVNNTSASATGTGNVFVGNTDTPLVSATLGGDGFITGDVTVNANGVLSPGNSIGAITVGTLLLADGSSLDLELGAAGTAYSDQGLADFISVSGALTVSGTVNLNLTDNADADGKGSLAAGAYKFLTYSTASGLGSVTWNIVGPSGYAFSVDSSQSQELWLTVADAGDPIPEPASLALLGLGAAGLLIRRRR